ncbi:MAG: adenosylcobinamide-phosphate synthase CbiB [Oligoflexus sp.]
MSEMGISILIFCGAWLVDQVYGEYPNRIHPVVGMGRMIQFCQQYQPKSMRVQLFFGIFLAFILPLVWAGCTYLLLAWSSQWFWLHALVAIYFLKASFALKALGEAAFYTLQLIESASVDQARDSLSSLCSRDASQLTEEELLNSAIASVAENLCDSVIAPLFYYVLLGVPGAIAYRVINTLDAMIGYKDERKYIGAASARLDDVVNWLPARISSLLLITSASILRKPAFKAWFIMRRDHHKTPSPNGGWSMAAMAGILGIEISKPGSYRLGEARHSASRQSLEEAWKLTRLSSLNFSLLLLGSIWIFH